jgi:sodium/potassium-transporting ATPase subunit beta
MADTKEGYGKDGDSNSDGGFKQFLWNPNTKEFLGRSGSSWAKILIFYIIFYACLAAFWAIMLLIFYQTIDKNEPKWKLEESRIGKNPGLGFRPRPPADKVESTLIWFTSGPTGNYKPWADRLGKFLKNYENDTGKATGRGSAVAQSGCDGTGSPEPGTFCPFELKTQLKGDDPCNLSNDYGYLLGTPCVLIKLNKIYGWEPKPYGSGNYPSNMPNPEKVTDHNGIIITCEGENPADKENIGPIRYTPSQTIKSVFFPFTNQAGYNSPFVMVQFKEPTRGVLINIECKAWASNIKHDRQDREGSVHFELLID